MSRADLERLRASDALQQTLHFDYLEGYHVPFDHLTAQPRRSTSWRTGRPGGGKSR
jgi:hypothetical protein